MKWLRENPFVAGLIAITVVGIGALGYFLTQFMGEYTTASEEYASAVQKLQGLQNRVPFPNEENLKKTKEVEEQYRQTLTALQQDLAKMKLPPETDVQPQQFQDNLRKTVNELKAKAETNNVALPANFYLGFNQYEATLPDAASTPVLARQLRLISQIVERLIDLKVKSIDELTFTDKKAAPAPAAPPAGGQPKKAPEVQKFPFTLAFTADQGKFRVAFNSLFSKDQFLIIRALALQNSNPVGPPIGGNTQPSTTTIPSPTAPESQGNNAQSGNGDLNVILGRELVRAVLKIEMIDFPAAPAPK